MKLNVKLLLVALSLGGASLANAGDRTFGNGDGELPDFLAVFDVDGDGKLNEEERQAAREARKDRRAEKRAEWDTDGDGVLSEEEREAAREAIRQAIEEKRSERFDEIDTDGDGFISAGEFAEIPPLVDADPERVAAIFDRLNGDDDLISKEEFLAKLQPRHRPGGPRPPRPGDRPEEGGGEEEEGGGDRPLRPIGR